MIHFFHGLIGSPLHVQQVCARLTSPWRAPVLNYLSADIGAGQVASEDTVVGNSIGCGVALGFDAARYILTAPPFDFSQGAVPLRRAQIGPWVSDLYQGKGQIEGEAALRAEAVAQLENLLGSRQNLRHIRRLKRQAQGFLTDPRLAQLSHRVEFVIGAQDYTTPPDAFLSWAAKAAPGAQVTVLEGCGHAVPVERPEAIAALIEKGPRNMPRCGGLNLGSRRSA